MSASYARLNFHLIPRFALIAAYMARIAAIFSVVVIFTFCMFRIVGWLRVLLLLQTPCQPEN